MILKNKKEIERTFKILFEIEKNDKVYVVYKDINTLNIYGGRKEGSVLKPLINEEYDIINDVLNKISGE